MTLFDLVSSPDVLNTGTSSPDGTESVKYAWADPQRVQ